MLTNNAKLRANFIETPEGEDNIVQLTYNGENINVSDVKWVMDYEGPTGRPCPDGLIREVKQSDFQKIIEGNLPIRIQRNDNKEIILHYIEKPQ